MRVVIVTKDNKDYTRSVDTFLENFTRQTGKTIEVLDPETREGESFARTYDIVQYPTLVALSDQGIVQNMWVGENLPTINEVSFYV